MHFDIPIVFFIFKRVEKSLLIMDRIAQIKPKKIYIISDEGRDDDEKKLVQECRRSVLQRIDWECDVVTNFAEENKGCYDRIGLGALWVFSQEEKAIFLEDDNMPEITFFEYCKALLERYERNDEIMWICGTNYLEKYETDSGADYVFSHHMLPCGWASWADKFIKYYDKDFSLLNEAALKEVIKNYRSKRVYLNDVKNWKHELKAREENGRFTSWDYQMSFSIRMHNKLGIVPCKNQITNIGVDNYSIHGGISMDQVMTKRFCERNSFPIDFPLNHPKEIKIDYDFERKLNKIVIPPLWLETKTFTIAFISNSIRKVFGIPQNQSIHKTILAKLGVKHD